MPLKTVMAIILEYQCRQEKVKIHVISLLMVHCSLTLDQHKWYGLMQGRPSHVWLATPTSIFGHQHNSSITIPASLTLEIKGEELIMQIQTKWVDGYPT